MFCQNMQAKQKSVEEFPRQDTLSPSAYIRALSTTTVGRETNSIASYGRVFILPKPSMWKFAFTITLVESSQKACGWCLSDVVVLVVVVVVVVVRSLRSGNKRPSRVTQQGLIAMHLVPGGVGKDFRLGSDS